MADEIDRCDFDGNREIELLYRPEVKRIIRQNLSSFLVVLEVAPIEIDMKEVGDFVVNSNHGHIASRIRRPDVTWRDLTIRTRSRNGGITELEKIRQGLGKWYFYGWADGKMPYGNGKLKDWMFIDLDIFRTSGLAFCDDRSEIPNKDEKTAFYAYSDNELIYSDCLVARHNSRLDTLPDGWVSWRILRNYYGKNVDFVKINKEQARMGDILSFYGTTKKMQVGIIKDISNGLVQVGATTWTPIKPHKGEVTIFKVTNNANPTAPQNN